jgi:hypothetical protein
MRTKISELNEIKENLESEQLANANSGWEDNVKDNFFDHHIEPMRRAHYNFVSDMEETATAFESGENRIYSLLYS